MTDRKISSRANGHAGPNGRPNGHGPASTERGGPAASDDASGSPVARAAPYPVAAGLHLQVSTDRKACAEVAPPPPNGAAPQVSPRNNSSENKGKPEREVPPGKYPLPDNPAEFVEEVHRKIDLIEVWHELLRSEDEKIRQRAIEKLTAMLYEDGTISSDDAEQIIFDLPRPKRD